LLFLALQRALSVRYFLLFLGLAQRLLLLVLGAFLVVEWLLLRDKTH
jgi:hypothetical protein